MKPKLISHIPPPLKHNPESAALKRVSRVHVREDDIVPLVVGDDEELREREREGVGLDAVSHYPASVRAFGDGFHARYTPLEDTGHHSITHDRKIHDVITH